MKSKANYLPSADCFPEMKITTCFEDPLNDEIERNRTFNGRDERSDLLGNSSLEEAGGGIKIKSALNKGYPPLLRYGS